MSRVKFTVNAVIMYLQSKPVPSIREAESQRISEDCLNV
jgi:hypothetical protein